MNMKNEFKVTKELMMSWAKEYHLHGAANIILFIGWCIVGLFGLSVLLINIFVAKEFWFYYISILLLLISSFKLFFSRFVVWSKRYKIFSRMYGVAEWMRTIEFTDDEIILTDHTSVNKFKYGNIQKIKEYGNIVLIFFKDNLGVRLYKDAFVEGSWEECKQKINFIIK